MDTCKTMGVRRLFARGAITAAVLASLAGVASANPQGAQVVRGDVNISTNGSTTLIRASHNSIINFRSFDIGAGETVQFLQPGADSRVLNRITGGAPTQIDGSLLANGRVYLVNPAGVFFGQGSIVNASGFFAAAGRMSDADFLRGIDRATLTGTLTSEGTINAGQVTLAGARVVSTGTINAQNVVIASGAQVLVQQSQGGVFVQVSDKVQTTDTRRTSGISSLGAGDMLGASLVAGDVQLAGGINASNVHIESTGDTIASGAISAQGGSVKVLGERVMVNGTIDASSQGNGGTILVGGDFQGKNAKVRNASRTIVGYDAVLDASSTGNGNGGLVVLWANDRTDFGGDIFARGGTQGGNGGLIEVSGKDTLVYRGFVNAGATSGRGGMLLLDPRDITINNGGTDSIAQTFASTPSTDVTIAPLDIQAVTNTGTGVILQANRDIFIDDPIVTNNAGGAGGFLQLEAGRSVFLNANIVTDDGDFSIFANNSNADAANRDTGAGGISFGLGVSINAGTGAVRLDVGDTTGSFVGGNIDTGSVTATTLVLRGPDAITQSAPLAVTNLVILGGGAGGNVSLTNNANVFSSLAANFDGALDLWSTGAVNIGSFGGVNGVTAPGGVTLVAGGAVTQTEAISTGQLTVRTRDNVGADITLNNGDNAVSSVILESLDGAGTSTSGGAISYRDTNGFTVGGLRTAGNATLLGFGAINQSNGVEVGGTLGVTTRDDAGANITFDDGGNTIGTFSGRALDAAGTSATDGDVLVVDSDGLVLGSMTGRNVSVLTGGNVSQNAPILSSGRLTVRTRTGGGADILLTDSANNANEVVLHSRDTGGNYVAGNISFFDSNGYSVASLGTLGNAILAAGGDITQAGAFTGVTTPFLQVFINGTGGVTLDRDDNAFSNLNAGLSGNSVFNTTSLLEIGGPDGLSGIFNGLDGATTSLRSNVAIIQNNAIVTSGLFSAETRNDAGGDIILLNGNNSVGQVSLSSRNAANTATAGGLLGWFENSSTVVNGIQTTGDVYLTSTDSIGFVSGVSADRLVAYTLNDAGANISLSGTINEIAFGSRNAANDEWRGGSLSFSSFGSYNVVSAGSTGTLSLNSGGSISQAGSETGITASILGFTLGGNLTLDRADNWIGGVGGSASDLNLVSSRSMIFDDVDLTGSAVLISREAMTQTGRFNIQGSLTATTLNDLGGDIIFNNGSNTVTGTETLRARDGADANDVSAVLIYSGS